MKAGLDSPKLLRLVGYILRLVGYILRLVDSQNIILVSKVLLYKLGLKGVFAKNKKALLIATYLTSIWCVYNEKIVKND